MCRELVSCADFKAIPTPLEGGVTVSNNFTKRCQNSFKIGTRDKFATHLRQENFISNEIVTLFIQFVFTISDFSILFSLYTQAVAYTTYFELVDVV